MGFDYDGIAQQALAIAQQALTVITEHKDYCERANTERSRLDVERDKKVQQLHEENVRQREKDNEAARKRWFATMSVMATMIVGLATFIIENWHK